MASRSEERRLQLQRAAHPKPEIRKALELGEFMECDVCNAKPGMPDLCQPCLHNRWLIGVLKRELQAKG